MIKVKKIKGKHYLFDLYGCDYHDLDDAAELKKLIEGAAHAAKMEILHSHFHKFEPHGVTGVLVLSTSHISVHTWPEYGYAAFDVFSCSNESQTYLAVEHVVKHLAHTRKKIHDIDRGYAELKTITIPIYKDNTKQTVTVHRKLAEIKSPFQEIQVLDLEKFGKTMLIDGITQVSVSDTHIYDEAITRELRPSDKEILILGGGDGFVAGKVLEKNPNARITIAELDLEVIYCARTYFDQNKVFSNSNVMVSVGDAMQYLRMAKDRCMKFDGIIIDLTDEPVGSGKALTRLSAFYDELMRLAVPLLKEEGWMSSQAGVPKAKPPLITTYDVLMPLFKKHLQNVAEKKEFIPSFLEENIFIYGSAKG